MLHGGAGAAGDLTPGRVAFVSPRLPLGGAGLDALVECYLAAALWAVVAP
jgi:hypothetical protein